MKNLDNIINEKKIKIKEIEANTNEAISNLTEDTNNALSALTEDYNNRVAALKKEMHDNLVDISGNMAKAVHKINNQYSKKIVGPLIEDLTADFEAIKDRGTYGNISKDTIVQVKNLKNTLSKIKDNQEKSNLLDIIKPEVKNLVNIKGIENMYEPRDITTYIAASANSCYILAPITDDDSSKLVNDFENWIIGVLNTKKTSLQKNNDIHFKCNELDYAQKFLLFQLDTNSPGELAEQLKNRLNDANVQPKSFKDYNLVSKAQCLDFEILKSFMDYSDNEEPQRQVRIRKTKSEKAVDSAVKSRISPEYVDPREVIAAYYKMNAAYRKVNDSDMSISEIVKHTVTDDSGKERSGWNLYYSLKEHLSKGTIKKEDIKTTSNLDRYVK
jgi:hypothetical protein